MTLLREQGYSLSVICRQLELSRQAYYKRLKSEEIRSDKNIQAEEIVIAERQRKSRIGLRSIYYKNNMSKLLGINKFEQEMSKRGYALKPYKSYIKTTDSRGHHHKYKNLISGMQINSANQLIVGDITYYMSNGILYYIFQFIDYFTLELKGVIADITMEGKSAEKCLRQVFKYNSKSTYNHLLILHTDGGSQYRSNKFQSMLNKAKVKPSHAKNCLENGLAERVNGIIKNEYLIDYDIKSLKKLNTVLRKIKYQINNVWPSKTLGYKTPVEFANKMSNLKKQQRPIRFIKQVENK